MDLTDKNADRITDLIQLAGIDGCPICLGIASVAAEGPPLADGQCCVPVKLRNPIQCSRNKYHLCSVVVFNLHEYLIVSVMDKLDRPI